MKGEKTTLNMMIALKLSGVFNQFSFFVPGEYISHPRGSPVCSVSNEKKIVITESVRKLVSNRPTFNVSLRQRNDATRDAWLGKPEVCSLGQVALGSD